MRSVLTCIVLTVNATGAAAQIPQLFRSSGVGEWGAVHLVEDGRSEILKGLQGLVVGRDGMAWIAVNEPARIRMYDADGSFVGEAARAGEGADPDPYIDGLQLMPDGGVAVLDGRLGRITTYDAQGNYRTSHRVPVSHLLEDMFVVDSAAHFYVKMELSDTVPGSSALEPNIEWIKISPAGHVLDTIRIRPGHARDVLVYGGPFRSRLPSVITALSPLGYLVVGDPHNYSFEI